MAKLVADPIDVICVEDYLDHHAELSHLRVRKHGALLILESGPRQHPVRHVRLRRVTRQWWTPEVYTHTGAWQPIPERGGISEVLDLLRTQFPWILTPQD